MITEAPLQIYKSSAGSGKTYTLTTAYLKLALESPTAFTRILAVTFTNKATQEMKDRIIKELKRLKSGVDPNETMHRELLEKWQLSPKELSERATQVLTTILHDFGSFSVSTIDSFFQKVIRAFAREIDLQAKFDVELDLDGVMTRMVDRLMLRVAEDPELHRWMVEFSISKVTEGKSWDVRKSIEDLGKKIFLEDFKIVQKEVGVFLENPHTFKAFKEFIFGQKQVIIDKATELKTTAQAIRDNNGLSWEDFSGGTRSFSKNFDQLGKKEDPIPLLTDAQEKFLLGPEKWYTKTSKCKAAIESAYAEGLSEILHQFKPLKRSWNTLDAIAKNLYTFGLFGYLLRELKELKEEENLLLISETNDFLKSITSDNDTPFIYEKVGNRYQHFLLDEFQDTSGFQWASFRPLLLNTLSMGKTNLVVGDVKQSIYRWRGGEMRLLMNQVEKDLGGFGIDVKKLDTNFRSLPNIVAFNNTLFSKLSKLLSDHLKTVLDDASMDRIEQAYGDVLQKIAPGQKAKGVEGKVIVSFIETDKETKYNDEILKILPEKVEELLDQGYQLKDIAILVRKNDQAASIADAFMSYAEENKDNGYRYDVLSDEALFLHKASVVKCLLAALEIVNDAEDSLAEKTFWIQLARIRDIPFNHVLFRKDSLPEEFKGIRERFFQQLSIFRKLPLMDLVEAIIDLADLNDGAGELAYLSGFKEAVYDFIGKNRADLGGFLNWWEQKGNKRTVKIPEEFDAIRIQTIHKSKGLQYKVVLLPYLDWKLFDTGKENIIWTKYDWDETLPPAIVPLSVRSQLKDSAFSTAYLEENLMNHLDSLNMLYVGFTRAEEVLVAMAPYKDSKNKDNLTTVADLLREVMKFRAPENDLLDFEKYYNNEEKKFELGFWHQNESNEKALPPPQPMVWKYRPWEKSLEVKQAFGEFETSEIVSKRAYGVLVHRIIEKSRTKKDFFLELQSMFFDGVITEEERELLEGQFNSLCQIEVFNSWFDGSGQVLTEQGIFLPGGEHKRPDRIIYYQKEIAVIDFKTGEKRTSHASQVSEYVKLVKDIEKGMPVQGYICYIESSTIEKVV
ncbi:UvrD-helicase domain-containing protein [Cyclobacterium marinum]|uniref:UvrD-helicase domain-containing protein n=1 Tax=Cyclobacterium marinum TaxID=104 RepID=UPI0011EF3AA1|nr:UvrD-helicase domain-containing protein [Cyclobacterium marinum]MBI0398830.1 UvrD-helicase domain-containing protein [Cyclobacterium marinum]